MTDHPLDRVTQETEAARGVLELLAYADVPRLPTGAVAGAAAAVIAALERIDGLTEEAYALMRHENREARLRAACDP